jgi:DNA-binding NarL/FixJ family response regulator
MAYDGQICLDDNAGDGALGSVLVVEDHHLLAQLIVHQLRAEGVDGDQAPLDSHERILAAAREKAYSVVLLDLDLGSELGDSIPLIGPLRETGAGVAMLTAIDDRHRHAECVEAGAIGIIMKDRSFDDVMGKLRETVARGSLLAPGERDELLAHLRKRRQEHKRRLAPFERLTDREQQVLVALTEGLTARDISSEWYVSYETVRTQIRSVLGKLGVHSQIEAVAMAQQAEWAGPGSPRSVPA